MDETEKYFNSKYTGEEMEERLDLVATLSTQVEELSDKVESLDSEDITWIEVQ